MAEIRRPETEEERRERVRRIRARKEIYQQRMRKKRLIRLSVYVLIGVLGALMILAALAIVRKVREDREEQAVEEALQEEITNSEFFDSSQILHLSFPVLTLDNAGSGLSVSQFRLILEELYAKGYMLVDPYMLTNRNEKGFTSAQIMVPAGKKPMILSQYDVSYEEGDTAHAVRLTRDASGRISCMYYDEYGSLITGAVDVVPIVEEFLESHPDFSYKGARGMIGVTGYRGLLGYEVEVDETPAKTIPIERPEENEDGTDDLYGDGMYDGGTGYGEDSDTLLYEEGSEAGGDAMAGGASGDEAMAGGDVGEYGAESSGQTDAERREAEAAVENNKQTVKELVGTLRSGGWYIASNTFDGISYAASEERVQADAEQWNSVIGSLVGATDLLMLPKAADIGEWSGYTDSNPRYTVLRGLGFRYFFVGNEETKTWAQIRPAYVRQSMHEITDYASYVAAMTNESAALPAVDEAAGERTASEDMNTSGTLELVGAALQPGETGTEEEAAGEESGEIEEIEEITE